MTTPQRDRSRPINESLVFDLPLSWAGYRINKMCNSLTSPENRAAYQADEEAYLAAYDLSPEQKALVLARDFGGLLDAGANIYFLLKLGVVTGNGLYRMGASMRGETYEQFLETRNDHGAV
ncbi:protocatechuate 3,4-dioxygenase [Pigmentiphaga litoralis]|uniref:Protocatechuate 4,5-dioxygenase alpha subunit n=1 Tax=Pigmentiphaga litoralis TaxID=516702 RepID=A0A7Y9IXM9_9BURK|nr:protocatechuate 3,4-dioxygenase [Pigmentiphaga litoralis]NYE22336.1 protocatechuate 4,5-dioxygenase alpha subunit [Pigmentiphaga litoralis]NYE84049.1 protocatechuate 4,5-dioxygenase alpha subunit [Pigmentiphaga litoralis]